VLAEEPDTGIITYGNTTIRHDDKSDVVIKVDFDFTMSILAHNILRLFALDLTGYQQLNAQTLYNKFLSNSGVVDILPDHVNVKLNKKRTLPAILTAMQQFQGKTLRLWDNHSVTFAGDTRS